MITYPRSYNATIIFFIQIISNILSFLRDTAIFFLSLIVLFRALCRSLINIRLRSVFVFDSPIHSRSTMTQTRNRFSGTFVEVKLIRDRPKNRSIKAAPDSFGAPCLLYSCSTSLFVLGELIFPESAYDVRHVMFSLDLFQCSYTVSDWWKRWNNRSRIIRRGIPSRRELSRNGCRRLEKRGHCSWINDPREDFIYLSFVVRRPSV